MDVKRLIARAVTDCPTGLSPSKLLTSRVNLRDADTGDEAVGVIVGWKVTHKHGLVFTVRPEWDSGCISRTAHALVCELEVPARDFHTEAPDALH